MSSPTVETPEAPAAEPRPAPSGIAPAGRATAAAMWLRVGLAVALLGASAAGRAWQSRRVDQRLRESRVSPIKLADLPLTYGPWVGHDTPQDKAIIDATGSTDSIFRVFQHKVTGQRVEINLLFGPAMEIYMHPPESCYPSAGYGQIGGSAYRVVRAGAASFPFREMVYFKGELGGGDQQEVFYSWRINGRWGPDLPSFKEVQRLPGIFKLQAVRGNVRDGELKLLEDDNPCEAFLALFMPELERRIAAASADRR
jgi:hypothetical protein